MCVQLIAAQSRIKIVVPVLNVFQATRNLTVCINGLFLCKKSRSSAGFFNICDFGMGCNFKPEPQNSQNLYTAQIPIVTKFKKYYYLIRYVFLL